MASHQRAVSAQALAPHQSRPKGRSGKGPSRSVPVTQQSMDQSLVVKTTIKPSTVSDNVFADVSFLSLSCVREIKAHATFTPNLAALTHISRLVFAEMILYDRDLSRGLTPEMFDYYAVALLWMRIIHLQQKNYHPMSVITRNIFENTSHVKFAVPEPILLFLKGLGVAESITKQRLYPTFPELPAVKVGPNGGYHSAAITEASLQDFLEVPCLGVVAEAVRMAISELPPGHYASQLQIANDLPVNENLPGYKPLQYRHNDAKNTACSNGITAENFQEDYENTAWNTGFIMDVSGWVARSKTFRMHSVNFHDLPECGSPAQLIRLVPHMAEDETSLCHDALASARSLTKEEDVEFGAASYTQYALVRAASPGPLGAASWLPITYPADVPVPDAWIKTLNTRRNMPIHYQQEIFVAMSQSSSYCRRKVISALTRR